MKRRNQERWDRERVRQFGPLADHVRSLPCAVKGCEGESVAAHVKGRRAYGAWLTCPHTGEAVSNIAPLCDPHHREQHQHGIKTFGDKYGFVMADAAREAGLDFLAANQDD